MINESPTEVSLVPPPAVVSTTEVVPETPPEQSATQETPA